MPESEPLVEREPVGVAGAVVLVVQQVIGLLLAFGVDLTDEQQFAVTSLTSAITVLGGIFWARKRAWSPASVRALP